MTSRLQYAVREFGSGEIVEPGVYIDVDTGTVVRMQERDKLPDGIRIEQYTRRFRRVEGAVTRDHTRRDM